MLNEWDKAMQTNKQKKNKNSGEIPEMRILQADYEF